MLALALVRFQKGNSPSSSFGQKEPLSKTYSLEEKKEFANLFGDETDDDESEADNKSRSGSGDSLTGSDIVEVEPPRKSPEPVIDLTADSSSSDDADSDCDHKSTNKLHQWSADSKKRKIQEPLEQLPVSNDKQRVMGQGDIERRNYDGRSRLTTSGMTDEDQCRDLFRSFQQPSKSVHDTPVPASVSQL